jgi:hypothetical protein
LYGELTENRSYVTLYPFIQTAGGFSINRVKNSWQRSTYAVHACRFLRRPIFASESLFDKYGFQILDFFKLGCLEARWTVKQGSQAGSRGRKVAYFLVTKLSLSG